MWGKTQRENKPTVCDGPETVKQELEGDQQA